MARKVSIVANGTDGDTVEPVIPPTVPNVNADGEQSTIRGTERETINGFDAIDATDVNGNGNSGGGAGRRRGRPAGAAIGAKAKGKTDLGTSIEKTLYSLHLMGAAMFSTPELALDEQEAKQLGQAIAGVAAQYDTVIDPKKLAWGQLLVCVGTIYGTRIYAVHARKKATGGARAPAGNVVDFKQPKAQQQQRPAPPVAQTPSDMWGPAGFSAMPAPEFSAGGD
jgi:hypothetical protein